MGRSPLKIFENYEIKDDSQSIVQLKSYKGKATISAIPSNINNLYEISSDELYGYMWGYNFSTNVNDIKHTYLDFYDNSTKEFKWKIQMFPITNQIQLVWHDKPYGHTDFYTSLSRSIINYI